MTKLTRQSFLQQSIIFAILSTLVMTFSMATYAQTKVVVIPMAGDDLKPLKNIITVARENGDFDNVNDAIASIADASSSNQYLLVIAPGEYELTAQVVIPEYVQVSGSGRYATVLTAISGKTALEEAAAAIVMTKYTVLSDLTLKVNTNTSHVIGIYNGGSFFSSFDKPALIDNVSVEAKSSMATTYNVGIYDRRGSAVIQNSSLEISGEGASVRHVGIYIYQSSTKMNNLDIKIKSITTGGLYGIYIENLRASDVSVLRDSNVLASYTAGSAVARAVYNDSFISRMNIRGSTLSGQDIAVRGGTVNIRYSSLKGGLGAGRLRCIASDNGGDGNNLAALSLNCLE